MALAPARHARSRARFAVIGALAVALAFGLTGTAAAKDKRDLTVMTQNVYLGADISHVLDATDPFQVLVAVATLYGQVQFTDFPARAGEIAAEIEAADADVVGLQEVANWTATGPGAPPSLDFLAILLQKLDDRGLSYSVASVSHNLNVGPVPLLVPCSGALFSCSLSYEDRDVILVNDERAGLQVSNPQSGRYDAQEVVSLLGDPLSFDRGWASIDGRLDGKKFTFVSTHLEIEDFAPVQEDQGREFLAGPAKAGGAVIAAGDFNSAADGSTTSVYADLTKSWFTDAWALNRRNPGLSCCQDPLLTNGTSHLHSRIDLVLTHGASRAVEAHLVGTAPFRAVPPLWPSDHAGLVATIRIH
jgi:endonuclease/exonuclease/phosphatase family metal-dependent hydrolase